MRANPLSTNYLPLDTLDITDPYNYLIERSQCSARKQAGSLWEVGRGGERYCFVYSGKWLLTCRLWHWCGASHARRCAVWYGRYVMAVWSYGSLHTVRSSSRPSVKGITQERRRVRRGGQRRAGLFWIREGGFGWGRIKWFRTKRKIRPWPLKRRGDIRTSKRY
jgi:hypothetical protein